MLTPGLLAVQDSDLRELSLTGLQPVPFALSGNRQGYTATVTTSSGPPHFGQMPSTSGWPSIIE